MNDHADGVGFVVEHGSAGEVYNLVGSGPRSNRDVTKRILKALERPWSLVRSVPDRPGHDLRYAMDGAKTAGLGWRPTVDFEQGLRDTIAWFVGNEDWWRRAKSGEWLDYYERQYGDRLADSIEA